MIYVSHSLYLSLFLSADSQKGVNKIGVVLYSQWVERENNSLELFKDQKEGLIQSFQDFLLFYKWEHLFLFAIHKNAKGLIPKNVCSILFVNKGFNC